MVRVWHLSMSMPAVQFRTSLGQGIMVSCFSPLNLGHCFDVVSLGKALYHLMLHLTQVKISTW